MKLTILAAIACSAAEFLPSTTGPSSSALHMSTPNNTMNRWSADANLPCFGLPGAPYSFMDPLNFTTNTSLNTVKRLREAEVMHGRVAMMSTVGYLIGESTPTIKYGMDVHHRVANNQLAEILTSLLLPLFFMINFAEAYCGSKGWVNPGKGVLFTLHDNYYPGDLGFDPLDLKPTDVKEFTTMQDGELNNGRLAMIVAAGMCVQEQVTGQGYQIFEC